MTTKIENIKVLFLLYLALKKEFVKAISIKKERIWVCQEKCVSNLNITKK